MVNSATASTVSSRKSGVMHHIVLPCHPVYCENSTNLLLLLKLSGALLSSLLLALALLQEGLRDEDLVGGWDASVAG